MSYDECTCDEMDEDDLHSCPFAVEIGGADPEEEHCNCCPECEYQCAMDI
jgi:hypothetical protein